ncbi:TPA: pentapeptide repeat-containing protein [Neisseria oralis]
MAKWNIWKKITETISKSKTWLHGQSNAVKVLCAGAMSVIIFVLTYFVAIKNSNSNGNSNGNSVGYWNFIILIVSAPVAFVIWHFRDENNRQQIENQRKDINLKEFQKLSEWVSGAHLPEIKTVNKTTQKSSPKDGVEITEQTTELSEEYTKKPDATHFDTFSKRDGAVALQISAIYNLLPFFRGDYGESFRRPAFNLLKSAWQAMQQDSLKKLDEAHLSDEERKKIFDELAQKAKSPMGVALTQVLLSLNRENKKLNLRDFPEMLPNICLAGMNFHLSGVNYLARDLSDLDLAGVDFRGAYLFSVHFRESQLMRAKLQGVNLSYADLPSADLEFADLQGADLHRANLPFTNLKSTKLFKANLQRADLQHAKLAFSNLQKADLREANLQEANLLGANLQLANVENTYLKFTDLIGCKFDWKQLKDNKELLSARIDLNDFIKRIYPDWKKTNDPEWAVLTKVQQTKAMQKFCNETGMLIVDESEIQEIMSSL